MSCCDRSGECQQGRDCHERGDAMNNVVHLRRVHELEPHVMPEAPQSMTLREAVICVACSLGVFALILAVAASNS